MSTMKTGIDEFYSTDTRFKLSRPWDYTSLSFNSFIYIKFSFQQPSFLPYQIFLTFIINYLFSSLNSSS